MGCKVHIITRQIKKATVKIFQIQQYVPALKCWRGVYVSYKFQVNAECSISRLRFDLKTLHR